MKVYDIPGVEGLELHHFYRAMAWLGEEIEEKAEGALAPRCVKDLIEEKLFERRRDLFADLSAVFMDTTSLSFYGEGGETLGEHGYSKDLSPRSQADDPRPRRRRRRAADLHRDVAGQYRRRDVAPAGGRPLAGALFHRPGLHRGRPRHDLGGHHRRA